MKLELSSEDPYALVYLARDADREELVTADSFSADAVVPRRLLARVMAKLARACLIETTKGRGEAPRSLSRASRRTGRDSGGRTRR
jgi:DNA-binding IscR family transcriptional regulator